MAGRAEIAPNLEFDGDRDRLREVAARLYGQGMPRRDIAVALLDQLVPNGHHRPRAERLKQARGKLRDWERDPKFRDLLWSIALIQTDMQTPQIVQGLVAKAKRGRVDAAKLALELTGRYTAKGENQPTQVAVVFNGIQRSESTAGILDADVVVGELESGDEG